MLNIKPFALISLISCLCFSLPLHAEDSARKVLKVCADPNYAPFSTREKTGYENKIAEVIANAMSIPVDYYWFPQRMGFVRNTLRQQNPDGQGYVCDLIMGVPRQFELAITTEPYMQSTYALVTRADGKLGTVTDPNQLIELNKTDPNGFKVGVTERSPGALWLAHHNMYDHLAPYITMSGDPEEFPGRSQLQDLLAGKIDAAIVWGPTAAYFLRESGDKKLTMLPMISDSSDPTVRFHYAISAAVRFGENSFERQLDHILEDKKPEIKTILKNMAFPLLMIMASSCNSLHIKVES